MKVKKYMSLLALWALCGTALYSQDIFTALENKTQWELADAYWKVADKFESLGQKTRAQEFRNQAKALYPEYPQKPSENTEAPTDNQIVPEPLEVVVDPLTGIPERPLVKERNLNGQRVVRFQFSKMIRGFITEDINLILSGISPKLSVDGAPDLKYEDLLVPTQDFFAQIKGEDFSPDTLFILETLSISPAPGTVDDWILRVSAQKDQEALKNLPFWKANQTYTFERAGDLWKLRRIDSQD